ncbi:hypothetical protein F5Y15DRAFT_379240 [Xylariaceae sp. FL0016]|nr:hypothetical protein F5Y15DRAFT_379240 [Xylariaceae sp. FL0016]
MTPWLHLGITSCIPRQIRLHESRSVYQLFDRIPDQTPRVLHMIGGHQKQQALQVLLKRKPNKNITTDVHLFEYKKQKGLVIDSPWPPSPLFSEQADSRLEGWDARLLDSDHLVPTRFHTAVKVFAQVASNLSHTIILFVDDFTDLSSVIELLSCWIRASQLDFRSRPRLLLISRAFNHKSDTRTRFLERLLRYITRVQHTADPTQVHTKDESEAMCWSCFESMELVPECKDLLDIIFENTEVVLSRRKQLGWAFESQHLRRITRLAVCQMSSWPAKRFEVISALRSCDPDKDFGKHVAELAKATKRCQYAELSRYIASALYADAYPKHGHRFFADILYKSAYQKQLELVLQDLNLKVLCHDIEQAFYRISHCGQSNKGSAFRQHLTFAKTLSYFFQGKLSSASCFLCIAKSPCAALTCGHMLCERCIRVIGSPQRYESCLFEVSRCPLCQILNTRIISLRPSTAANRILLLDGPPHSKRLLGHFFKDLQYHMALTSIPIRDHFDTVRAGGTGVYYMLGMYLRKWSISQCIEGSNDLGYLHLRRNYLKRSKCIDFGGVDESWPVKEIRSHSGTSISFQHQGKCYSNSVARESSSSARNEVVIHYGGGIYEKALLRATTNQLIGSMFFIELLESPQLFTTPGRCCLRLMCAVPSGPGCASLRQRLEGAEVLYRSDNNPYRMRRLRTGSMDDAQLPPTDLAVDVTSHESVLDVVINKGPDSFIVGRCPYKVQQLVDDQGIDNCWHTGYRPPQHRSTKFDLTDWAEDTGIWHLGEGLDLPHSKTNWI